MDTSAAASLADVLELRYTLEPFIVGWWRSRPTARTSASCASP